MQEISRIDVISLGRIMGVLYAIGGLVAGAVLSLFAVVGISASPDGGPLWGMLFGAAAIIFLPILYGLLGFVGGVITAWIYNIVARLAGGLRVELRGTM